MSKGYELQGTVKLVEETREVGSKGFMIRDFVVTVPDDKNGDYDQDIKLQFNGDNVDRLDQIREGDIVKVQFNLRGSEWQGKYFTNLIAWRIDVMSESKRPKQEVHVDQQADPEEDDDSSMPF